MNPICSVTWCASFRGPAEAGRYILPERSNRNPAVIAAGGDALPHEVTKLTKTTTHVAYETQVFVFFVSS